MSEPAYITRVEDHQRLDELEYFCEHIVRRQGVRSYLEVGSKWGCSLFAVSRMMPKASTIVSIDKPKANFYWNETHKSLTGLIERLNREGHDAHVLWGDSTDPKIIDQAGQWAPYDLVFIDANHALKYVTSDWENYGQMGRIVAFHDIGWRRDWKEKGVGGIDVPQLWERLKDAYTYVEIKKDPKGKDNGIGVLIREGR